MASSPLETNAPWRFAVVLFSILISASGLARGAADDTLTVEAVVKLWVSGTSVGEIVARIEAGDVEFELSPEILEELTVAGLPGELLRAMQARQAEVERDQEAATDAEYATGERFSFRLNPEQTKAAKRRLIIRDEIAVPLLHQWRLDPDVRFEDVAVFLACSTADHVPDHWQTRTPLYWKAAQIPRHRMLVMLDGASWVEETLFTRLGIGSPKLPANADGALTPVGRPESVEVKGRLVLALAPLLATTLVPEVPHDLHLGIALKAAGRFYPWTFTSLDGVVLDDGPLELDATIRGLNKRRLEVLEIRFDDDTKAKYDARTVCTLGCPRP